MESVELWHASSVYPCAANCQSALEGIQINLAYLLTSVVLVTHPAKPPFPDHPHITHSDTLVNQDH